MTRFTVNGKATEIDVDHRIFLWPGKRVRAIAAEARREGRRLGPLYGRRARTCRTQSRAAHRDPSASATRIGVKHNHLVELGLLNRGRGCRGAGIPVQKWADSRPAAAPPTYA